MSECSVTAAAVIRFTEQLEDTAAGLYDRLAAKFEAHRELFAGFAKDSRKNKTLVLRTYQETITDALEACYCFDGLVLDDRRFAATLKEQAELPDALTAAVALEEQAVHFYLDIAQRSQALLATIPRAFRRVAEVRGKRKEQLQMLLSR